MKKNYIFTVKWALLLGTLTYGQAPKFSLDFEGLNPLSNLPAGVTNVNGTNTVRVKNTTNYPAIPNAVQNKSGGGKELFLDFQGYLKINVPTPSTGFSLAYDYRRNDVNDDWYLGFLSFIGNNGSGNVLERLLISQWDGKLDFGSIGSAGSPISFNTNYKIVVTCSTTGDFKVYVDNVLKLSAPNATSGKNIHTWTNTSLLLSFKGESFDGTNVTPETEYATNSRDARAFVDNVELYERELTPAEITNINFPPYAQAPKFFLNFEGVNPLSNLPAGVTNVNGTNTVRVKNTTNYPAIPNAVQADGTGGKELFLDFHGYLKMNVTPTTGFSLAFDYRKSPEDADWYLGFLTIIGNNGSGNVLEQILIKKYWESLFDFSGTESSGVSQNFETEAKIVVTCSKTGGIKIYVNSVKVLDRPNSSSGKNFHTWTNASLLLSFKGNSFDGTNVTPENEYTLNARDTRAYVDNIALYEGEISASEVAYLSTNGNNSLSLEDQKVFSREGVGMYPNPVNDVVKFSSQEVKSVVIYTILGAKIMTSAIINSSVDVSGLKAGVYIVNCFDIDGKKIDTIKLIKLY